jgi:hypothetical protein
MDTLMKFEKSMTQDDFIRKSSNFFKQVLDYKELRVFQEIGEEEGRKEKEVCSDVINAAKAL